MFFRHTQETEEDANQPVNPKHTRVLVVEDSRTDTLLEAHALERYGIREWKAVESAEQALDLLDRETFSVALLDYSLPRMNGLALLERIKEKHPAIRVILVTGARDEQLAVAAMKLGADDYVVKDEFLTAGIISSLQSTLRSIEYTRKTRIASASSLESGIAEVETLLTFDNLPGGLEAGISPGELVRMKDQLEDMKTLILTSAENASPTQRILENRIVLSFIDAGSSPRDIIRLHYAALQSIRKDAALSATTRDPACVPTMVLARLLQRVLEDLQRSVSLASLDDAAA